MTKIEWKSAQMGIRKLERATDGGIIHRVPTYVIQLIGANLVGWFGWDPLNERWVSSPFGLPFAYQSSLRSALEFIDWEKCPRERFTINWLAAYPHASSYGVLTVAQRKQIAFIIDSGERISRPIPLR